MSKKSKKKFESDVEERDGEKKEVKEENEEKLKWNPFLELGKVLKEKEEENGR